MLSSAFALIIRALVCFTFFRQSNSQLSAAIHACTEWFLGFSGESCTQTCTREAKICSAEVISDVLRYDNFTSIVPLSIQLGTETKLPIAAEFCNGGINTWPFATAPAVMSYEFHEKEEETQSRRTSIHYNCYFPSVVVGDCDTKFMMPAAQRFCACISGDCIDRKRLRGKIYSKF